MEHNKEHCRIKGCGFCDEIARNLLNNNTPQEDWAKELWHKHEHTCHNAKPDCADKIIEEIVSKVRTEAYEAGMKEAMEMAEKEKHFRSHIDSSHTTQ